MGYTHFDKISAHNAIAIGEKGSETDIIDESGGVNPTVNVVADGNIAQGDLVYFSGYDATTGYLKAKKADADAADPAKCALFVAPAAITDTESGTVVGKYELEGQDTSSATAVGDPVYLSTTAGGWALSAPSGGGQVIQHVGVVTAKHATEGKVLLFPFYSKTVTVNTTA